eukprot:TRINITY_DN82364_c0_g1_i1.p1 TRINITY_DN82364_c0_g1~~TRINITY_DN82364_c0_g1_i1.p1  ORF type:complete len:176 (-),score=28.90 TRINITY_DN82364_c0_g1_i1:40-567(-)
MGCNSSGCAEQVVQPVAPDISLPHRGLDPEEVEVALDADNRDLHVESKSHEGDSTTQARAVKMNVGSVVASEQAEGELSFQSLNNSDSSGALSRSGKIPANAKVQRRYVDKLDAFLTKVGQDPNMIEHYVRSRRNSDVALKTYDMPGSALVTQTPMMPMGDESRVKEESEDSLSQ